MTRSIDLAVLSGVAEHRQGPSGCHLTSRPGAGSPCFNKRLYRERNLIERFSSKLKHVRRVTTSYDKLAAKFLAMVQLAPLRLWLRA